MEDNKAVPEKKKSSGLNWLIGCFVALFLLGLCCAGGVYFGWPILKEKGIDYAHSGFVEVVEASGLPEAQVTSIIGDLGRLRDAALEEKIDFAALEGLDEELARLGTLGFAYWYETEAIENSDLSPEEKTDAQRVIQRFSRGIEEETLHPRELEGLDVNARRDGRDDSYDADEIRRDVAEIKTLVDEAGIPDEPFRADVALSFARLVDGMLID